jgi:hypothetical protein
MNRIDLTITDAAKARLLLDIANISEYEAIATVVWSTSGAYIKRDDRGNEIESGDLLGCWSVGFYSPSQTIHVDIQYISGIKFVFDQGSISERLNGKVLDIKNGYYHIQED